MAQLCLTTADQIVYPVTSKALYMRMPMSRHQAKVSLPRCNSTSNAGSSQVAHAPAAVALLLCTLIKEPENAGSMCTRRAKRKYLLAVCTALCICGRNVNLRIRTATVRIVELDSNTTT